LGLHAARDLPSLGNRTGPQARLEASQRASGQLNPAVACLGRLVSQGLSLVEPGFQLGLQAEGAFEQGLKFGAAAVSSGLAGGNGVAKGTLLVE